MLYVVIFISDDSTWLEISEASKGLFLNSDCRSWTHYRQASQYCILTDDMVGLNLSPVGGCVTSAPRKMTGSRNTAGLQPHQSNTASTGSYMSFTTFHKLLQFHARLSRHHICPCNRQHVSSNECVHASTLLGAVLCARITHNDTSCY